MGVAPGFVGERDKERGFSYIARGKLVRFGSFFVIPDLIRDPSFCAGREEKVGSGSGPE
jgi:hypothetical protein